MLRPFLIGIVAGQRGLAPLAALVAGARHRALPVSRPVQRLIGNRLFAGGSVALAAAEMAGDKMKSAPDRIVPAGLIVRALTSACSGAVLAPRGQRGAGAALAMLTALGSSYLGWRARCAMMRKYGQTKTGFAEDALVMGTGLAVALAGPRR